MPYIHSDPAREYERHALPNVWITRRDRSDGPDSEGEPVRAGWYYAYCFPGCMPDSDWYGPYRSYGAAVKACRDEDPDGHPLPENGYVYRASRRRYLRNMTPVCYTVDTRTRDYSYRGKVRIEGQDMHVWRVRPARRPGYLAVNGVIPAPVTFRPYYVFSLNVADE